MKRSVKKMVGPVPAEPAERSSVDERQQQWEQYRLTRLRIRATAMRRVKFALIAMALLAGGWFLYLLYHDSQTKKERENHEQ